VSARRARTIAGVALVLLTLGGIHVMRGATMSTHYETGADSRMVVVVHASNNRSEPGTTLDELAEALINTCVLEVSTNIDDFEPVAGEDDLFTVTLRPALDSTDRKQYRGCLEDWSVDHVRLDVVSMTDRVVEEAADGAG
jgi:hypothetical protein